MTRSQQSHWIVGIAIAVCSIGLLVKAVPIIDVAASSKASSSEYGYKTNNFSADSQMDEDTVVNVTSNGTRKDL